MEMNGWGGVIYIYIYLVNVCDQISGKETNSSKGCLTRMGERRID